MLIGSKIKLPCRFEDRARMGLQDFTEPSVTSTFARKLTLGFLVEALNFRGESKIALGTITMLLKTFNKAITTIHSMQMPIPTEGFAV